MWDTQTGKLYSVQTIKPHEEKGGDFCKSCGAWRGSLGLEPTPELYVRHIVEVMREVRRVLRKDGTLWLNLGDSYAGSWGNKGHRRETKRLNRFDVIPPEISPPTARPANYGLKPKDLVGIPWRVAFALQADGWWLRSDIIWHKVNPMPESVRDRPTRSHEFLFLLTKSRRYFFDQEAVREPTASGGKPSGNKTRFVDHQRQRSRVNTHLGSSVP
jgi:DNA modification methylase